MSKRKVAAVVSALAVLGVVGSAAAQTPVDQQYSGGGVSGAGGNNAATSGSLPFTGFQAGLVLLGGAGVAATGLALRRVSRQRNN